MTNLLEIRDLRVRFGARGNTRHSAHDDARDDAHAAVRGLDLDLAAGETLALVGESGCGKSTTALALMRLVPQARVTGTIRFAGQDLHALSARAMRAVRGAQIAMIFQEPMTSLNPVLSVGAQIVETLRAHAPPAPYPRLTRAAAWQRALELLERVRLPEPRRIARAYPHELSGGQRQRAMIAMAVACQPRLLIADEPTTALDATIQAHILDLLDSLRRELSMSLLLITHDLGVVAKRADRVAVMLAGEKVEEARVGALLAQPRHPYTKGLLDASLNLGGNPRTALHYRDWILPEIRHTRDANGQPDFTVLPRRPRHQDGAGATDDAVRARADDVSAKQPETSARRHDANPFSRADTDVSIKAPVAQSQTHCTDLPVNAGASIKSSETQPQPHRANLPGDVDADAPIKPSETQPQPRRANLPGDVDADAPIKPSETQPQPHRTDPPASADADAPTKPHTTDESRRADPGPRAPPRIATDTDGINSARNARESSAIRRSTPLSAHLPASSRAPLPNASAPLLDVRNLRVEYAPRHGGAPVRAVDDVSLQIARGETVGLVGESGCGKSSLSRAILRLLPNNSATSGQILLRATDLAQLDERALRPLRRHVQMVFQDPYASLNPRRTTGQTLDTALAANGVVDARQRRARIARVLDQVGLPAAASARFPHEFSGGQRQRIGLARALILQPDLLICDEPVSALDVSIQAQILNLLVELKRELGLAYLFISHDLAVVRYIADRVHVMQAGRIVESSDPHALWRAPQHPYTRELLGAIAGGMPGKTRDDIANATSSEIPDAIIPAIPDESPRASSDEHSSRHSAENPDGEIVPENSVQSCRHFHSFENIRLPG